MVDVATDVKVIGNSIFIGSVITVRAARCGLGGGAWGGVIIQLIVIHVLSRLLITLISAAWRENTDVSPLRLCPSFTSDSDRVSDPLHSY